MTRQRHAFGTLVRRIRARAALRARFVFVLFLFPLVAAAGVYSARAYVGSGAAVHNEARYAELPTPPSETLPEHAGSVRLSVPILVYHIVRPSYPSDSPEVRALALTPETFDAQMSHLKKAGYHVIGFRELEDALTRGAALPKRPIILSFDDGWKDQFTYAFPILVAHGYSATFFVFSNSIGQRGFLSWDDLRTLRAQGMTIGSHTRSHPYLTEIKDSSILHDEIYGSKRALEAGLGTTIREFAYPFGAYNRAIAAMARAAGYRSARGDYDLGFQSSGRLFGLSALNAPTTTARFMRAFP